MDVNTAVAAALSFALNEFRCGKFDVDLHIAKFHLCHDAPRMWFHSENTFGEVPFHRTAVKVDPFFEGIICTEKRYGIRWSFTNHGIDIWRLFFIGKTWNLSETQENKNQYGYYVGFAQNLFPPDGFKGLNFQQGLWH